MEQGLALGGSAALHGFGDGTDRAAQVSAEAGVLGLQRVGLVLLVGRDPRVDTILISVR